MLGREWWRGGREVSVPRPDQEATVLISRELLGLDEFLFEGFEGLLIQVELELQCPVGHALPLTEQGNHLIEDGVKVHRDPPKLKSLPSLLQPPCPKPVPQ